MQRTSSSGRVVYGRNGQVQRPEGQLVIAVRLFWTWKDPQLTSECQISQPPSEVLSKPWQKTNSIRGGTCCSGTSLYIGLHCCALPSGGLRLFIIILCVANCRTNLQRIYSQTQSTLVKASDVARHPPHTHTLTHTKRKKETCPVALHFVSQESRSSSASLNCLLSSQELQQQQQPGNTNNCLCAGGL